MARYYMFFKVRNGPQFSHARYNLPKPNHILFTFRSVQPLFCTKCVIFDICMCLVAQKTEVFQREEQEQGERKQCSFSLFIHGNQNIIHLCLGAYRDQNAD